MHLVERGDLLARALSEGLPDGFRVLWGACDPLSTPRPLAPFQDMAPLAATLAEERGKHGLLTALLDQLSVETVMVVEDAHWADEATLDALRFIGRRVTGTRGVVLVTYRDDEVGADHPLRAVLGDLATAPGCERLHVPALTPEGVRVPTAGAALDPDHLHRVTGGNAFYVSEVLAAPGWTVPLSVADAVLARVSRLPPDARNLVDLVSVAPGGLEPEVAARLLDDLGPALDEAVGRGVLVLSGARVAFRHELARLAIEGALAVGPPPRAAHPAPRGARGPIDRGSRTACAPRRGGGRRDAGAPLRTPGGSRSVCPRIAPGGGPAARARGCACRRPAAGRARRPALPLG
jgi:hypothetical protein